MAVVENFAGDNFYTEKRVSSNIGCGVADEK